MGSETNYEHLILYAQIEKTIFTIRGTQVMIDRDLAQLYGVEPKRLGEQVRRNIDRFPEAFRFQLTEAEKNELVANCDRFEPLKHASAPPYAFTEQGVAMLSAVLRSDTAVKVSIQIMQAFVSMRRLLAASAPLLDRRVAERPGQEVVRLLAYGQGITEYYGSSAGGADMTMRFKENTKLEGEIKKNLAGLGYGI